MFICAEVDVIIPESSVPDRSRMREVMESELLRSVRRALLQHYRISPFSVKLSHIDVQWQYDPGDARMLAENAPLTSYLFHVCCRAEGSVVSSYPWAISVMDDTSGT